MTKTAFITGASSGIGRSLALELAERGYNLALTARRLDRLEALKAEIAELDSSLKVGIRSLDVKQALTVAPVFQDLLKEMGDIDLVIANAGVNSLLSVGKGQLQEQLDMLTTNIQGAIATIDAGAEYFRSKKSGHLVGISSLASLMPIPKQAAYCATKAAFSMYLDSAGLELKRQGIKVTKILPGFIKTEIVDNMEQFPFLVSSEQAAREIADQIEKGKATGVVPGYPWKFVKPFMANIPASVWRVLKV